MDLVGILTTSTVGIQTANVTSADLVGAATSMVGLYIGDGHLLFSNYLNKSGGYYITTGLNMNESSYIGHINET